MMAASGAIKPSKRLFFMENYGSLVGAAHPPACGRPSQQFGFVVFAAQLTEAAGT